MSPNVPLDFYLECPRKVKVKVTQTFCMIISIYLLLYLRPAPPHNFQCGIKQYA